jgi:hypothetical protein
MRAGSHMPGRNWLARGLLLVAVALFVGGGWYVARECSPAKVRKLVLAHLREEFPAASVQLGSAHARLLGGISFEQLTVSRPDDPDRAPFLHVPAGIIYPDKELIAARGKLAVRKVELHRPRLRAVRDRAGGWNLAGTLAPGSPDQPLPTFVIKDGIVVVEDAASPGRPIEVTGVELAVVNPRLPTLTLEGRANAGPLGAVALTGTWDRVRERLDADVAFPAVPFGPALVSRLAAYAPEAALHLREASGMAAVRAHLGYRPGQPLRHDVSVRLAGGHFAHPELPLPLDDIDASFTVRDGRVAVEKLTARAGGAKVVARAEMGGTAWGPGREVAEGPREKPVGTLVGLRRTGEPPAFPAPLSYFPFPISHFPFSHRPAPPPPAGLKDWEKALAHAEVTLDGVELTESLFADLPPHVRKFDPMFRPRGRVSLDYRLQNAGPGEWSKRLTLTGSGASALYQRFPYPVTDVTGSVVVTTTHGKPELITLDIAARAGGRPVTLRGKLEGDGPDPAIDLEIAGTGVPLDETLLAALPERYRPLARSFHPTGQGDFVATVKAAAGTPGSDNRYLVQFRDASVRYDVFPYPLENVAGTLDIRTGRGAGFEFRGFRGSHNGGAVTVSGREEHTPDGDRLVVEIGGKGVPLDGDLAAAMGPVGLAPAWRAFGPSGRLDFAARVTQTPRPPRPTPGVARAACEDDSLDVQLTLRGGAIRPEFFPYPLTLYAATVHARDENVEVIRFAAGHGVTRVTFDRADVVRKAGGGTYADLVGLRFTPLVFDADLIAALPGGLREGVAALRPTGPMSLDVARLVVDDPAPRPPELVVPRPGGRGAARLTARGSGRDTAPPVAPTVYWDGSLKLGGVTFTTGLDWSGAAGEVACRGRFEGDHMAGLLGNVLLERASVLGQPLTRVRARLEGDAREPDVLRLYPHAEAFGGDIGGEARVAFGPRLRYDLNLSASGIRLEEMARHNHLGPDAKLQGLATGQLFLTGREPVRPEDPALEGHGSLDVLDGQLYNLPLLLDLFKVLNLRAPDRTAFEEAHARFALRDRQVTVSRLDLMGNAVSLGGRGELQTDGTGVDFRFHTIYSRASQFLPQPVQQAANAVSRGLYQIRVSGSVAEGGGGLTFRQEPVPALVQPLKHGLDRVRAKAE